jgi:hypothetical protein
MLCLVADCYQEVKYNLFCCEICDIFINKFYILLSCFVSNVLHWTDYTMAKLKRTHNDLQNTIQNTKDQATRLQLSDDGRYILVRRV